MAQLSFPRVMAVVLAALVAWSAAAALAGPAWAADPATGAAGEAPLTLDQAMDIALAQNPALAQAAAARQRADLAYWAAEDSLTPFKGPGLPYRATGAEPAAVNVHLVLRQLDAARDIARWGADYARETVRLQTATAFYGVLKAQSMHDVAAQALERARAQCAVAASMRDAGMAAHKDVLDAEVGVASAEAGLSAARGGLEMARMALNLALGRSLTLPVAVSGDLTYKPIDLGGLDVGAYVEWALLRKFEVRQAQSALDVAQCDVKLTKDFQAIDYDRSLAAAALEEARQGLIVRQQAAEFSVRSAYLALVEAQSRVEACQRQVAAAQEAARLSSLRYQNGMATSLEVTSAELLASQADSQLIQAMYDHRLAQFELRFVSGKSLALAP